MRVAAAKSDVGFEGGGKLWIADWDRLELAGIHMCRYGKGEFYLRGRR